MKRKIQLAFVSLLASALLALSISAAYATKPETMTLKGTVIPLGLGNTIEFSPGNSGNEIVKIRDIPVVWTGDITAGSIIPGSPPTFVPGGFYSANRLDLGDDENIDVWVGTHFLKDATIKGVGNGDLSIGHNHEGYDCFIKSGSGELRSIRGTGTITPRGLVFDYIIVIQINP